MASDPLRLRRGGRSVPLSRGCFLTMPAPEPPRISRPARARVGLRVFDTTGNPPGPAAREHVKRLHASCRPDRRGNLAHSHIFAQPPRAGAGSCVAHLNRRGHRCNLQRGHNAGAAPDAPPTDRPRRSYVNGLTPRGCYVRSARPRRGGRPQFDPRHNSAGSQT